MNFQERDEQRIQYTRAVFDTIPMPAFIVDEDVRIFDFNQAAEPFIGPEPAAVLCQRGGEAFHCINAEHSGCGKVEPCQDCVLRQSVRRAIYLRSTYRELHQAKLVTPRGAVSLDLLVTANLLPYTESPRVLLLLENVSQLLALVRLKKQRRPKKGRTRNS